MIINHNITAINTHNKLSSANAAQGKSMEKLASGLRINKAGDDAAGLAISEKMRGQVRGLDQASRNAQDGISMIQTAEGALNETHDILQRMRELSVQSSNDTNTLDDRKEMQKEVSQLKSEIDRISTTTEFNTQKLLNGSVGAVGTSSNTTNVSVASVTGLKVGDYSITVDTAATKSSAAAGSTDFTSATDVSAKDLTINGTKIDFSGMTSATNADVLAKINSYSSTTGVTATDSSGSVKLDQSNFGSSSKIVLGGTDAAEFGGTVTAGEDAVATFVDADNISQQVTGVGQNVNYKSAEFVAKGAAASTATVSVTSSGASLQIGANKDQNMLIDINEISTKTLGNATDGFIKDLDVTTQGGANKAILSLDNAIQSVSGERSKLGAFQNRLDHTINNLKTSSENLTAAESRIRDVDMAKEMMNQTKNSILAQAAQAMLAQSNQTPQGVLQLLR
ncbi:flagellin [Exiguobacterium sp. s192]|uniref:flagellin N-terminal helical domain-containing protein n=1 Tax=Exiguobacterium sp. s192 TaxID=2751206 RepID=UPI001BE9C29E|nr:flagellin [Exiguobacterium sp. s192]